MKKNDDKKEITIENDNSNKEKIEEKKESDKKEEKEKEKSEEKKEEGKEEEKKEEEKDPKKIIEEQKKTINELTDKYLRTLAEFDNFRKRVAKERDDFIKFTKTDVLSEILPVLDNLERGYSAMEKTDNVKEIKKGIEMVIKQFKDTLTKMGVKEVEAKGIFDHNYHHVMHKEERDDKEEGEILEVYQKGYMFKDKLIRPAMVKVAIKKKKEEEKSDKK